MKISISPLNLNQYLDRQAMRVAVRQLEKESDLQQLAHNQRGEASRLALGPDTSARFSAYKSLLPENGFSFVTTTFDRCGRKPDTIGLRYEKESDIYTARFFTLSGIAGLQASGGHCTTSVSPGLGLKAQLGLGETANVYTSAMGTANAGTFDHAAASVAGRGEATAGVGARLAVGLELSAFYGEFFTEKATNFNSEGFALGARLRYR